MDDVSLSDAYAMLLAYETRLDLQGGEDQYQASGNIGSRGNRGGFSNNRGDGQCRGGGGHGDSGRGHGSRDGGRNDGAKPLCQLCQKTGHTVHRFWKRFDRRFSGDDNAYQCSAAAAISSYGVDTNWYADNGGTDHITGELDKLTECDKYSGPEQVHKVSGSGMDISHIGKAILNTPSGCLHLNDVLHVSKASKKFVSVSSLTSDNHVFMESHPSLFFGE